MITKEFLEQRLSYLESLSEQAIANINGTLGAKKEIELMLKKLEVSESNATNDLKPVLAEVKS